MIEAWACQAQRTGVVLVWVPVLAAVSLLNLHGGGWQVAAQVGLALLAAASSVVAVLASGFGGDDAARPVLSRVALGVLSATAVVSSTQGDGWLTPWILLAITAPVVLRGWPLALLIAFATIGSAIASWLVGDIGGAFWISVTGVLLAGVATTSFLRLIETNEVLRRTRAELARTAVADERERFSRDLHDLLGHTLSVMVVKAEAVRRLVERDPGAAAAHAADIEQVGREALVEVREAVDAMRNPSLAEALDGARQALDAAGIRTEVANPGGDIPEPADQALAWVVREGATNVLRHSGAQSCRFEVSNGHGELRLVVADDGVGGPKVSARPGEEHVRQGGLDGLRRRLVAAGGDLEVDPGTDGLDGMDGFRLTARVPAGTR